MIEQWSIAAAAGAFVILTLGFLLLLYKAVKDWRAIRQTVEGMGMQVQTAQAELARILEPAADTVQAVNDQLQSSRKLLLAAEQASEVTNQVAKAAGHLTSLLSETAGRYVELSTGRKKQQIDEALQWAEIAVIAWQLWQNGKIRAAQMEEQEERPAKAKAHA